MIDPKDSSIIKTALTEMIKVVITLQQSGHSDLALALRQLAERAAGSEGLRRTRHEIVENLVFIGQQAALRPEKRNQDYSKRHSVTPTTAYKGWGSYPKLGTRSASQ